MRERGATNPKRLFAKDAATGARVLATKRIMRRMMAERRH